MSAHLPPHVVKVREDEGAVDVKAAGDDVLGVLPRQPLGLLDPQGAPKHLLVVRQLDHQRHLEGVLQVPADGRTEGERRESEGAHERQTEGEGGREWEREIVRVRAYSRVCVFRYFVNMKGTRWPRCRASLEGPRPVYLRMEE